MKAILVCGLPCSGKTMYVNAHYPEHLFIDDPKDSAFVESTIQEQPLRDIVVADPQFCLANSRNAAIKYFADRGYCVEVVYFENDPTQCYINYELRKLNGDNRQVHNFIRFATKRYFIPDNATVLKVWSQVQ